MIWQNGWAWAGLATLALPILIHLLGRGRVRLERFPTLRFLPVSRLLPAKRTRLHDLMLLAIRLGILVAAVAALAQPLFRTAERRRLLNGALVRAIVVDTSASMWRATPSGGSALASAQGEAQRLADSSQVRIILQTAVPARALDGAIAWLDRQEGRGEVAIVSDFQAGSFDAGDLAKVPLPDGIRLIRIPTVPVAAPVEIRSSAGSTEIVARTTNLAGRSDVEWSRPLAASVAPPDRIAILAAPSESEGLGADRLAAATLGVALPVDTAHAIAIVYPQFPECAALLRASAPLRAAWMTELIVRVRSDPLLLGAAAGTRDLPVTDSGTGLVVARSASGRPLIVATQESASGGSRLLLFPLVDPGTLLSAALIAATRRAMSVATPVAELEPAVIPDSLLATWRRPPAAQGHRAAGAASETGASDGRWLWVLALALLLLETWFRNRTVHTAMAAQVGNAVA